MDKLFEEFKNKIDESITLIEDRIGRQSNINKIDTRQLTDIGSEIISETESLLDRCNAVCLEYKNKKPTLRIIHHLACSGGTLISKCISSMPNVYLLSEVHPYTELHLGAGKAKYLPSDITSLAKYAGIPYHSTLAKKILVESVKLTYEHVSNVGGFLVIRDHSHSDYCVGKDVLTPQAVKSALGDYFDVVSLITLRNPIDSYASLVKNKWLHFEPKSFDEYCKRILKFLDSYSGSPVILYEDFVDSPQSTMRQICHILNLTYSDMFEDVFDIFKVTGDSGRSGNIIEKRERTKLSEGYKNEICSSENFSIIQDRFSFKDEMIL